MTTLAVLIGALLLWSYALYPLVSAVLARARPTAAAPPPGPWPRVVVLVAARDEAACIAARVANLGAQDYPGAARLLVVSDGSTDDTVAAAREAGAAVLALPHVGKTAALERALETLVDDPPDLVAFSDATALWPPDTLRALARPFADPTVGAVSGRVRYEYPDTALGAGFADYQRLIVAHRAHDARWGTLTSVSGSVSAARWAVVSPQVAGRYPPALSTDLLLPLEAARAGLRSQYVPDAISVERARAAAGRELQSRIRLALSAYAFVAHAWRQRGALPAGYLLQLVSHKVLRWLSPALVVVAAAALAMSVPWTRPLLGGALAACVGCAALAQLPALRRIFGGPLFAATVALGYLIGLWRFIWGQRPAGWDPGSQR